MQVRPTENARCCMVTVLCLHGGLWACHQIVIVVIISKLLKRLSKPSAWYQLIHERCSNQRVFKIIVRSMLGSGCHKVRGGRLGVKASVV